MPHIPPLPFSPPTMSEMHKKHKIELFNSHHARESPPPHLRVAWKTATIFSWNINTGVKSVIVFLSSVMRVFIGND
jgi:hypothetical protein